MKLCEYCNKQPVKAKNRRFCSYACSAKSRPTVGFWYDKNGYINKKINGKNIKLHREVMEEYLGRKLSVDEIVHHINENKLDNRIENLMIMTKSEHQSHHANKAKRDILGRYIGVIKFYERKTL